MILYLLAIGFVSILGQVVILRELNVAFYGVELIYILAIAVWLLWTAVGALIGRRTYVPSKTTIGVLLIGFAILLPADVALVRGIRVLFGGVPGAYLPFSAQILGLAVVLLPIGLLLGLLFQWAAKLYIGTDKTLAAAYAIESAGGIIGGLASTLFLKFGLQNFAIAVICGLFAAGLTLLPGAVSSRRIRCAGAAAFAVLLLATVTGDRLDQVLTRINHPTLVESRDSPYSRVTVTQQMNQFVVFENDALAFETQSPAAEELVHLAAIHVDSLRLVLVLGGGVEGVVDEILKYAPRHVDYVELNPVVVSLTETHLPPDINTPLTSERVTLRIGDPRRFTRKAEAYDLVLIAMPDPSSGRSNRFYTREFFEQCSEALGPDGVVALRLKSSENIWTRHLTYRSTSIFRALKSVFRDVVVMPGVTNIIVASQSPLERDPSVLAESFVRRGVRTRLVTPEYISYLFTNDRFFEIASRIATTEIPPNSDVRPVCYRYSSMIWLSKFFPTLANLDAGSFGPSSRTGLMSFGLVILFICFLFLVIRRWAGPRRIVLVTVAGFVGMVVETILILHYQVKAGVLYQNLGILLMVFMAGLAAGAPAILKAARFDAAGLATVGRVWGSRLFIGFAALNLAFVVLLRSDYSAHLFVSSFLLFVAGFLVSGVLAYASLSGVENQKIAVSPLYAADLLGGCLGSVLGSLLLIPFFGMEETAAIMAIVSVAALLLV